MEAEGIAPSAISAFESTFNSLVSGNTGLIPEDSISPAPDLDCADDFSATIAVNTDLLKETVMLKLNGGLGTGMGLDKAKSLLEVKGLDTFLDLTAKQVIQMRKDYGSKVKFMLMNSFATSKDTLDFLQAKYPALASEDGLEMMQNKVPKIDAATLEPAVCSSDPDNEWCPPGHGDLYAALVGSGCLDSLLQRGFKYMFVSNSDNLGASLDLTILSYFAEKGAPFLMECCERTENDKKGGHLAVRKSDSQLVLRESAMCAEEDEDAFSDISKHRFFNTNNLWIRLDKLKEIIDQNGGFIPLPMMTTPLRSFSWRPPWERPLNVLTEPRPFVYPVHALPRSKSAVTYCCCAVMPTFSSITSQFSIRLATAQTLSWSWTVRFTNSSMPCKKQRWAVFPPWSSANASRSRARSACRRRQNLLAVLAS
jgi:hypothetical protein